MSHVLLLPFGTSGSVLPFIWLGRQMVKRGHRVTMITDKMHRKDAVSAGLNFKALESDVVELMLKDEDLWRPGRGSRVAYKHAGDAARYYVLAVEEIISSEGMPDLMLAPMICFGARLIREKRPIPLVSVHLYPMMFVSAHEMPLVMPAIRWLRKLPLWLRKAVLALPSPNDVFALPAVWKCCLDNGVMPPLSLWRQWWHSPDGVLALFPSWYAAPQPDWPTKLLQWDFPLEDMAQERTADPALISFLEKGPSPLLFTAGTGQFHARSFFATALALTEQLGCRAVLLTAKPDQLPSGLPPSIFVATYAPFSVLLPYGSVFVHHGGIGTIAQSLMAGVPQLVVDMALDQHDNAERVERLGVGLSVSISRFSVESALPLLQRCLTDLSIRSKAGEYAETMKSRRDLGEMVEWLEKNCIHHKEA